MKKDLIHSFAWAGAVVVVALQLRRRRVSPAVVEETEARSRPDSVSDNAHYVK